MSNRFKNIQPLVFVLFFAAWMLQSLSPVLTQQTAHLNNDAVVCSIPDDSGSSCDTHSSKDCNCNHHTSDYTGENNVTICGCDHHGSDAVAVTSIFQIKAALLTEFIALNRYRNYISPHPDIMQIPILAEDIFHPPRLNA